MLPTYKVNTEYVFAVKKVASSGEAELEGHSCGQYHIPIEEKDKITALRKKLETVNSADS